MKIRNGRIVGSPLEGVENYDLKRLPEEELMGLQRITTLVAGGYQPTNKDMEMLIKARKAARVGKPLVQNSASRDENLRRIADTVAQLRDVLK